MSLCADMNPPWVLQEEVKRLTAENDRLRAALRQIADGPWPDGIDTPEEQCRFDEDIARAALSPTASPEIG